MYKNREVEYLNRRGEKLLLPNIDNVFKHQNQQIVELTEQTEKILLPQTFNSFSEAEQILMQHADIKLMKVEFNAIGSLRRTTPMSRGARHGIMAAGGLVTHVPKSIDMLKCTFNGNERMYVLTTEQDIGSYKLHRFDENKTAILDLFPNDGKARDDDYKLKTHPILVLKAANEEPDKLIDKLVKPRGERLCEKLQQEGYQETTRQKVDTFFLSLIPFYTMITEAQKDNNKGKAVVLAGVFDLLSFLPFIGKGTQVGSRFSIPLGEAAINGVRTALKQATIRQILRESGKQFVKFGIPHITDRLPAKAYLYIKILTVMPVVGSFLKLHYSVLWLALSSHPIKEPYK